MDKQAEIARIKAEYEARNKEIERQHRLEMAKIIGGGLLSIGSAFIPGTAGLKVAGALGKTIAPMVGKKIGTEIASGLVSGGLSGAVEGFGRGLIENKNPLKTMAQDSAVGLATGGLGGLAVGKIGQNIARKSLPNNPQAQKQYYNNYLEGLNNNAITKQGFNIDEIRGLKTGNYTDNGSGILHDSANPRHVLQAKLINEVNPANDSYHTWIRTADDIYNFEDTLKAPVFDEDFIGNDFDPSYSWDMAQEAIKNGQIEVYSSYPIDKGVFVSPSYMEAEQYAGGPGGKVYSKLIPLNDVAWIDPTQGQYAPVKMNSTQGTNKLPKPVINQEESIINKDIVPYKESNYFKQRQERIANREKENLYNKLMGMSEDLKSPKPIEEALKKEGKIGIMKGSESFEPDEINYSISEIVSNMSPDEKAKGYAVRKLGNNYTHLKYNKDGNHELGKYQIGDTKYD